MNNEQWLLEMADCLKRFGLPQTAQECEKLAAEERAKRRGLVMAVIGKATQEMGALVAKRSPS